MIPLHEFTRDDGRSPFGEWFDQLDNAIALKVNTYLTRMSSGNFGQCKSVGGGLHECRIDQGPGYRVYFGKEVDRLIILLAGGTKKRQQADIENARIYWKIHKERLKG
jgi:putative addiction module killer protein